MAATRLTDSQKIEIVARYRAGEVSSELAEAYGCVGIRATKPAELDDAIREMIKTPHPVLFDCRVANLANCFPMIPSGKAHNEMLLGEDVADEDVGSVIDAKGKMLV